jgi:glutaredoxin-like protein
MMPMIRAQDRAMLAQLFAVELAVPVSLIIFTQRPSPIIIPGRDVCELCEQTEQLVKEVGELSEKLSTEVYDFTENEENAKVYGVDKIPAVVLIGAKDYGIRFYGIPLGYEFVTLVEAILDVSRGSTDLGAQIKEQLQTLDSDVHIQVFTTPTCPYCSQAVRTAHQMAVESDHVRADAIEITEFPRLIDRYRVRGVPKVIINETRAFEGALPTEAFLAHVLDASGSGAH